jgi:hypothetical protein
LRAFTQFFFNTILQCAFSISRMRARMIRRATHPRRPTQRRVNGRKNIFHFDPRATRRPPEIDPGGDSRDLGRLLRRRVAKRRSTASTRSSRAIFHRTRAREIFANDDADHVRDCIRICHVATCMWRESQRRLAWHARSGSHARRPCHPRASARVPHRFAREPSQA